jgi:hypothetical protein
MEGDQRSGGCLENTPTIGLTFSLGMGSVTAISSGHYQPSTGLVCSKQLTSGLPCHPNYAGRFVRRPAMVCIPLVCRLSAAQPQWALLCQGLRVRYLCNFDQKPNLGLGKVYATI